MGLDVGDRRIGVALSDPTELLASPLTTIQRTGGKRDVLAALKLADEHEAELIVVGLPRLLSGEIGEQARKSMEFADKLRAQTRVPIVLWDERYSTVTADELMGQAGRRPEERRARIDAAAAAVILQSYLDHKPRPGDASTSSA
ncbi:MAG: Holliday junction resolvase RuvX [Chloroflexota bacterium]|nr:MAG: Holliday junction resolvase RuvX [Chloroflexota bacterium]